MKLTYAHIFMALTIIGAAAFFFEYWRRQRPRLGTIEWIENVVHPKTFNFSFTLHKFTKADMPPLAILLVVFGFISYYKLGDFNAPTSFHRFYGSGDSVIVAFDGDMPIDSVWYYTGLNNGSSEGKFRLEYSHDCVNWFEVTDLEQTYANLFQWITADYDIEFSAQFLRLTSIGADNVELGELAVFSGGNLITGAGADDLFDDQDAVPDNPTYMNSMYFDEIYHGRAAYEMIRSEYPYEWVHPPLGKILISAGVQLFGMTPFGWRCVGTMFGILMIAAMYILLKNMFGKPIVTICGTLLLCFDFMRYTQSRIATVDSYPTFFIIVAFLFMYRFLCVKRTARVRQTIRPLFFSGLFWGLGAASKWTVIYAGIGLAVLFFVKLGFDIHEYVVAGESGFISRTVKICIAAAGFFIVMPSIIYIISYIPYGYGSSWIDSRTYPGLPWSTDEKLNMTVRNGMLWNPRYYQRILKIQKGMYDYHANLGAYKVGADGLFELDANGNKIPMHPYQSMWYQWILDIRPILYYWRSDSADPNLKHVITCFTNPIITWGGLAGVIGLVVESFRKKDAKAAIIAVGYFSQIVPWMLITRCVFAYHYFPSLVFLIITLAYFFDGHIEREPKRGVYFVTGFTAAAGILFVLFYPVLSGAAVSKDYSNYILQWLPSWQL